MIKTKKLKVTLLMGVIACFIAVFCCMQAAFANNVNSNNSVSVTNQEQSEILNYPPEGTKGSIDNGTEHKYFRDAFELKKLSENFEDSENVKIFFFEDFDFQGQTLEVSENQTLDVSLQTFKLFSSTTNSTTFFKVNGTLKLGSHSSSIYHTKRPVIEEPIFNASVKVTNDGAKLYIRDIDFISNSCPATIKSGGHFDIENRIAHAEFNNCNFSGHATNGGIFYLDACGDEDNHDSISISNCVFDGCKATDSDGGGQGGAIYNNYKYLDINFENIKILNCHSDKEGGAIASIANGDNWNFYKTLIDNCTAGNDGGAIYVKSSEANFIGTSNSTANNNFNYPGTLNNTCLISNCKTVAHNGHGGAIYTSNATGCGNKIKITGFDFINNQSLGNGGAIQTMGTDNVIDSCYFENNVAGGDGGAVDGYSTIMFSKSEETKITNCEFYNNKSNGKGHQIKLSYVREMNVNGNKLYHEGKYSTKSNDLYADSEKDSWDKCISFIRIK